MSDTESPPIREDHVEHRTPPGADLLYYPCFLRRDEADRWFALLAGDECVRWRQDHIQLYGRRIALPRLTAWYGEPGIRYVYSGIVNETVPWDEALRGLAQRVGDAAGTSFNAVLLNLYRDDRDAVSWHSDDEAELGPEPVIASLSVGAERTFQLRHKDHRRNGVAWEERRLPSGSLLVMRGSTQRLWQHRLPRHAGPCGPRINLSFRRIEAGRAAVQARS
jgi:alkylated DNA repair dioxygenase AlkB